MSDSSFIKEPESFLGTDCKVHSKPLSQFAEEWDSAKRQCKEPSNMAKAQDLAGGGPCPELLNLRFKRLRVTSESKKLAVFSMDEIIRWTGASNVEEKSHD